MQQGICTFLRVDGAVTAPQSPHRTFDAEEADFFYVPVYVNVYTWPVFAWADGPWFAKFVNGAMSFLQHLISPPPSHRHHQAGARCITKCIFNTTSMKHALVVC